MLLFVSFLLADAHADRVMDGRYGEKVKFTKGTKIVFPDFVLEYVGQRRESSQKYPQGFLFYDFAATAEGATRKILMEQRNPEILGPPHSRSIRSASRSELKRSDKLGPLKDDQLVVWNN